VVAQSKDDFSTGANGIDPAAERPQPWGGDLDRLLRQLVEKLASTRADGSKGGGAPAAYDARLLPVVVPRGAEGVHVEARAREKFRSLWAALLRSAAANGAVIVDTTRRGARRFAKTVDPFAPPVALFLAGVVVGAAATIYSTTGDREHGTGVSAGDATVEIAPPSVAPQPTTAADAAPREAPTSVAAPERAAVAASSPVDPMGKAQPLAYAPAETAAPGGLAIRSPIKPRARGVSAANTTDQTSAGRARASAAPEKRVAAQPVRQAREPAPARVRKPPAPASATQSRTGANKYGYVGDYGVEGVFAAVGKKLDSLVPR
jgi:hypothetical protein